MKIALREITFADNSKKKVLVINNDRSIGSVKVSAKQWKQLAQLGIEISNVTSPYTEQYLINSLA